MVTGEPVLPQPDWVWRGKYIKYIWMYKDSAIFFYLCVYSFNKGFFFLEKNTNCCIWIHSFHLSFDELLFFLKPHYCKWSSSSTSPFSAAHCSTAHIVFHHPGKGYKYGLWDVCCTVPNWWSEGSAVVTAAISLLSTLRKQEGRGGLPTCACLPNRCPSPQAILSVLQKLLRTQSQVKLLHAVSWLGNFSHPSQRYISIALGG